MTSLSVPCAFLCLLLYLHVLLSLAAVSDAQLERRLRRKMEILDEEDDEQEQPQPPPLPKKKTAAITTTTTTTGSLTDGKNQTKTLRPPKPKKATAVPLPTKSGLNKTLAATFKLSKLSNSTKLQKPSNSTTLLKPTKASNATTTIKAPKASKTQSSTAAAAAKLSKKPSDLPPSKLNKTQSTKIKQQQEIDKAQPAKSKEQKSSKSKVAKSDDPVVPWYESVAGDDPSEEETDLISEFRDLPSKFQKTLFPDLKKISTTSKVYLYQANKEITRGVKPLVGNRYAPAVASATSALFVLLPLLLLAALLHQVRTYLSLPRILLFVHAYLAIYFAILSLTAVVTGLEPLRLFYATSPGPYLYTQVLQTLGYVLFLLLQLMYLVVVFATEMAEGAAAKAVALGQIVVGLAVGLHYYTAVFHRAVVGEPPKTNWRVHGLYAACFLAICGFARAAERRKKAYLLGGPGSDEGKKS